MTQAADDERLQALTWEIATLQAQEEAVRRQLGEEAAKAAARLEANGLLQHRDAAEQEVLNKITVPDNIPAILKELAVVNATQQHMAHVQELQGLTRQLQRDLRTMDRPASTDPTDLAHYFAGLREAIAAHSRCLALSEATAALPTVGVPPQLLEQADVALEAADSTQEKLVGSVGGVIRSQMALLGWPPPLTSTTSLLTQAWQGLEGADDRVLQNIDQAVAALVVLQRSVQRSSFQPDNILEGDDEVPAADGPPLWAVEQVAQPLADKLRQQFGRGGPIDQPDRPELLLSLVIKLTRSLAPTLAPLQAAIAPALADLPQHSYFVPVEFARAMRAVVQAMLKEHLLPALQEEGSPHAWLHLVECLVSFERELAPLRGLPRHTAETLDDALELWAPGSCLEVLCTHQGWREGWWEAERGEALRQLEEVCDAPDAWQPAALVWDAPEEDLQPSSAPGGREAWREEFWPPCCADAVLLLVVHLARKAAWLGSQHLRSQFAAAVPRALLAAFKARLERLLKTAQDFRALASESWAPRVAAYACAARHLQHSLREATGALLLLDLPGEEGGPSMLAREADSLGSFQDKTAKRLARAVATRFSDASAPYAARKGLEAFGATTFDGREARVSAGLEGAVGVLEGDLARLALLLDAVLFRQLWRYVAVGIQHALFNNVATEARFSRQGSQQFATDVAMVINAFAPWTPRPAAHFRELSDAVVLLNLSREEAQSFRTSLEAAAAVEGYQEAQADGESVGVSGGVGELLEGVGVTRLTVARALAVLDRRQW